MQRPRHSPSQHCCFSRMNRCDIYTRQVAPGIGQQCSVKASRRASFSVSAGISRSNLTSSAFNSLAEIPWSVRRFPMKMTHVVDIILLFLSYSLLLHALPQRQNASDIDAGLELNTNTSLQVGFAFEDLILHSFHAIGGFDTRASTLEVKATSARGRGSRASDFNIIQTVALNHAGDRLITTHNTARRPNIFSTPTSTAVRYDDKWPSYVRTWDWHHLGHTLGHAIDDLRSLSYAADWLEVRLLYPKKDFITGQERTELWYAFLRTETPRPVWILYATHSGRTGLYAGDIDGGLMDLRVDET